MVGAKNTVSNGDSHESLFSESKDGVWTRVLTIMMTCLPSSEG